VTASGAAAAAAMVSASTFTAWALHITLLAFLSSLAPRD